MAFVKGIQIDQQDYKISRRLFARIWRLTWPYWVRKEHWRSWTTMLVLLVMAPGWTFVYAYMSSLAADLTNAIVAKQEPQYSQLFVSTTVLGVIVWLIQTMLGYFDSRLDIHWRKWLTDWLVDRYLARKTYYDIALAEDLDNPDQRIHEDVAPVTTAMANIPRRILGQVTGFFVGAAIIASIRPQVIWFVIGYAVVQTVVMLWLYTPSIKLNFESTVAEADLRYGILHIRDHAETIAFYRGEPAEHEQVRVRLSTAVKAKLALLIYNLKVSGVGQLLGLIWTSMPFFLITPLYFRGEIQYGAIAQATLAASMMLQSINVLSEFIPIVTGMAPRAVRLAQILERFDKMDADYDDPEIPRITVCTAADIRMENLTLLTPGGEQCVVRDLNLNVRAGEHLVIVGQTGVGKSSLLRAMAGLWRRGSGRLSMPEVGECLFLPQRPYMTLSDLRSQLLYPREHAQIRQERFQEILERVRLPHLLEKHGGLDAVRDWAKVLSLGEQQRIGFARALIMQPKYIFLDESTSAVDLITEDHLYRLLGEIGCTFVSVGHRESILKHHVNGLRLLPGGSWELIPADRALSAPDAAPPVTFTTCCPPDAIRA